MDVPRREKTWTKRKGALFAAVCALSALALTPTFFVYVPYPQPPTVYAAHELFGTVETCELPVLADSESELDASLRLDGGHPKKVVKPPKTEDVEPTGTVLCVNHPVNAALQSKIRVFKLTAQGDGAFLVDVLFGRRWFNATEVISGLNLGDRIILMKTREWDAVKRLSVQ